VGENFGELGEYDGWLCAGLVGLYTGEVGLYVGDVGEYFGEVGEVCAPALLYCGLVGL
jgi:hypothetical protein